MSFSEYMNRGNSNAQTVSISFWLPVQVALLVLYYGNIVPNLPWWLVWLPSLALLLVIFVVMIIVAIVLLVAWWGNH
ncbi:MAG: hypothetical protein WC877_01090 [Dehalococcoidales bacterium]|jgi:hypothetical protein